MGTNFYTKTNKCRECGNQPEGIHLGKASAGWEFTFQYNGGQYYKNIDEMTVWLRDKVIIDEYGVEIAHNDFWKMVQNKKGGKKSGEEADNQYTLNVGEYTFLDTEFG